MPGLVDAHCHIGLGPAGPVDLDEAAAQARTDRDAGTLLIRDCGSPVDTRPLQARADLPEIIRAGRHLARPKRYIPGVAVDLDDPALLPELVAEQAAAGDGWVKLVGRLDRPRPSATWPRSGPTTCWWPRSTAAHAAGARVTAHVFGTDALPGLIHAGIDCIEHGTGLTDDLIAEMARRGTALVPTLINIDTFPGIADSARRATRPTPRTCARCTPAPATWSGGRSRRGCRSTRAPTPAAGSRTAGSSTRSPRCTRPGTRTRWARPAGRPATGWAGPACTRGARPTCSSTASDPRADPAVLRAPALILLRGRVYRPVIPAGAVAVRRVGPAGGVWIRSRGTGGRRRPRVTDGERAAVRVRDRPGRRAGTAVLAIVVYGDVPCSASCLGLGTYPTLDIAVPRAAAVRARRPGLGSAHAGEHPAAARPLPGPVHHPAGPGADPAPAARRAARTGAGSPP